jgi:hypothetical protein
MRKAKLLPGNKENYQYREITLALTVDTNAYGDGDVVGGLLSLPIRGFNTSGFINKIRIVDDDEKAVAIDAHFYSASPTVIADNAAWALSTADAKLYEGKIAVAATDYTTYTGNETAIKQTTGADDVQYETPTGTVYIYLALNGAGVTFTAGTDLTVTIGVWHRS